MRRNMKNGTDDQRAALAGWDNEGGAAPADRARQDDTQRQKQVERSARQARFDSTHDSSVRGEHRYPDTHQTTAERKARDDRDALKRKLGGTR